MPTRRLLYLLPLSVVLVVVVSHLAGLETSPPGLFGDEAAFGYNGWSIANHGVDQYGTAWPLFFRSFGDYKGSVAVYSVALLTALLPLTPFIVRASKRARRHRPGDRRREVGMAADAFPGRHARRPLVLPEWVMPARASR
jgi:hypothetical protein